MKNKIYTVFTIILLTATIFIVYSKFNSVQKNKQLNEVLLTRHYSVQKLWQNRELKFPKLLYNLRTQAKLEDFLSKNKKEFTIISYLNADCSNCVTELNKWTSFLDSNPVLSERTDIVFIASSSNIELFKYQVYDKAKFEYNIFFDKKNEFVELNKISTIKTYQTFLLKNEKILYLGSPIRDKLFEEELKQIIINY
ncbi:hypothetical protein U6A24_02290 [Aquimarina gracilis]|uniref:Redoxin domain-containing protein n=1 Tax=Aquimarina gracilis TaxID=874422 RepID=A0ABU5ZRJ3_9FLAO|nr:hypothetical protein [Aquimarina gracilis]MEB3344268.1 hypothetical protein [Aquimarina gracilis]